MALLRTCTSSLRTAVIARRTFATHLPRLLEAESRLPRIAQPSTWQTMIPKAFRRRDPSAAPEVASTRTKDWNPATIFIFLGILVGSNAIQILSLRREMLNFSRKTDAKLELLREVVEKVKNGEANAEDVKRLLGTGNPEQEKEWEEVMREVAETDMLLEGRKKRERKTKEKVEAARAAKELQAKQREGSPVAVDEELREGGAQQQRRPKFRM